jgi:uncharacterized protein involved in propanediol utilization
MRVACVHEPSSRPFLLLGEASMPSSRGAASSRAPGVASHMATATCADRLVAFPRVGWAARRQRCARLVRAA